MPSEMNIHTNDGDHIHNQILIINSRQDKANFDDHHCSLFERQRCNNHLSSMNNKTRVQFKL